MNSTTGMPASEKIWPSVLYRVLCGLLGRRIKQNNKGATGLDHLPPARPRPRPCPPVACPLEGRLVVAVLVLLTVALARPPVKQADAGAVLPGRCARWLGRLRDSVRFLVWEEEWFGAAPAGKLRLGMDTS